MTRVLAGLLIVIAGVGAASGGELRLQEGRSVARDSWSDRVERARQDSARYTGAAVDAFRLRTTRLSPPKAAAQPGATPTLPGLLDDPTLRYGDVIAVEGRLIVFRGAGLPHRAADFQEIGTAGTLGGVHDTELRAIDRVLARNRPGTR